MPKTILNDTVKFISEQYGERLGAITIERIAVGIFFTAVKLSSGSGGISYTPALEIHRDPRRPPLDRSRYPDLKGISAAEVLARSDETVLFETIRLVVMNALTAPLLVEGRYNVVRDLDVLDIIDLKEVRRVAMVGAITPFIERLRHMPWLKLDVIEKKSGTYGEDVRRFCVPLKQTRQVLSACDMAVITGAAVANGTIDSLLDRVSRDAVVIIAGPTASFAPDALFARGVAVVSGVKVKDADRAVDMVSEGALAYHLFKECVEKVSVINPLFETGKSLPLKNVNMIEPVPIRRSHERKTS